MMKAKVPSDVKGYDTQCPNFMQCPMCYGCRNYDPNIIKCVERCGGNMKQNVCNTQRHKEELIAKFITKEKIIL